MTRILVAGDTHGQLGWCKWLSKRASANDCATILQVGDFGYWEHKGHGRAFLDDLSTWLVARDQLLVWVDGNHENHPMLWEKYPPGPDGFCEVRPHILYAPRGHRWEWGGRTFVAVGGAFSIDKGRRTPGESWWATETLDDLEVTEACAGGKVDVVVAHDCPWGVDVAPDDPNTFYKNGHPESQENRFRLLEVVRATRPELLIHGHYHVRYSSYLEQSGHHTLIEGFGRDGDMRGGWGVLELPSLNLLSVKP